MPADEIERVWRYASEAETVTLDRLDGESWPKRQAQVAAAVAESARHLVELARAREATTAPKLAPPRQAFERFVARFPFSETPDQARAIADALADLASGRPMDRLVCGDVGFGKTEVALRAAAAAALAGKQVAVAGPDHRAGAPAPPHLQPPLRRPRDRGRGTVALGEARRGEARQGGTRRWDHPGRDRHPCGRGEGTCASRISVSWSSTRSSASGRPRKPSCAASPTGCTSSRSPRRRSRARSRPPSSGSRT